MAVEADRGVSTVQEADNVASTARFFVPEECRTICHSRSSQ